MIGRKSLIAISVLCALALCAFAAANASAEQRAFTCKPTPGSGEFTDAHCLNKTGTGFTHEAIANGTPTSIEVTNSATASATTASTPSKLEGSLSGVETAIECTGLGGTGSLTNSATSMSATFTINYTSCSVTKPTGEGCRVRGGSLTTEELRATTEGQAANRVKVQPAGEKFMIIPIEGCNTASLNNEFPIEGVILTTGSGATLSTTHAGVTGQPVGERLKFGGVKSGVEGKMTVRMSGGGNPIVLT